MNSQFIEVGIGLVFVFLLMSIMVSAANEMIMSLFSRRGRFLKESISEAIDDPLNKNWSQLLYDHPLIDKLKKSERRPPAYISSQTFALTLIEVISNEGREDKFEVKGDETFYTHKTDNLSQFDRFKKGLDTLKESHIKNVLQAFVNDSNGNYSELKAQIENWFNEYMDRVGGWYKRKMKRWILLFSAVLTLVMNVDTIQLSIQLWNNAALRETIVNAAESYVETNSGKFETQQTTPADSLLMLRLEKDTTMSTKQMLFLLDSIQNVTDSTNELSEQLAEIRETYREFDMLDLPIGWTEQNYEYDTLTAEHDTTMKEIKNAGYNFFQRVWFKNTERLCYYSQVIWIYLSTVTIMKLFGWIFTAIAVSFGAPYWFDMLNKLINVRGTGKAAKKIVAAVKPPSNDNQ